MLEESVVDKMLCWVLGMGWSHRVLDQSHAHQGKEFTSIWKLYIWKVQFCMHMLTTAFIWATDFVWVRDQQTPPNYENRNVYHELSYFESSSS